MSQNGKRTSSSQTTKAIGEKLGGLSEDIHVMTSAEIVRLLKADDVVLWHEDGLDPVQHDALGRVIQIIEDARERYANHQPPESGRLVSQHRSEANRRAVRKAVSQMLTSAVRMTFEAGVNLKVTVGLVWFPSNDSYRSRAVLQASPAKWARRSAA